jgi:DNA-binding transcriptional LysR family regulator
MQSPDSDEGHHGRPSLRELEVLHAVIVSRKTTAAAQRLGLSQPAVSRAISALESRLGRALFDRDGGRLVPNAEAYALDAEAAPIFAALGRLEQWPQAPQAGGVLRLMAPPTIAHLFVSPLLIEFLRREPEARIQMEIGRSPDAISAVADGSADIGLVDAPVTHAGVRTERVHRSAAHVLMPAGHPLAALPAVTPADLSGVPLVLVTRRFSARARIERAFADHGVEPRVVLEAGTLQFLADVVRAGLGLAVINPFPIVSTIGPDLIFRPFEPVIQYDTSFLFPAAGGLKPLARRFVDFVRSQPIHLPLPGR